MNEFIEKYKTDKKFNAKVQLIGYAIFIVFITIFAILSPKTTQKNDNNNLVKESYNYQINISLNDKLYKYYGTKDEKEIIINKVVNEEIISYTYKDNNYYKNENDIYTLTKEEEIYDIIEFNYLSLNTINKYLSISTLNENKNIVYLKDIILGSNSEEYITIEKNDNDYNVDYTSLMKIFDNNIEKLTIEIIIE